MILFFAGDLHGRIKEFYDHVKFVEKQIGVQADWVLQTGNFGIWPDPSLASRAARKNGSAGEFADLYFKKTEVPRPTLFVAGPHEDHHWLDLKFSRGEMELVPNLHWLVNGYSTTLLDQQNNLKVVGMGKVFSPNVLNNPHASNRTKRGRYLRSDIEKACSQGPVDLILAHQAPAGARLGHKVSNSAGLSKVCFATRPSLYVHGHYNYSYEYLYRPTGTPMLAMANGKINAYEFEGGKFTRIV